MPRLSTENVEEIFKWEAPGDPKERLVAQVSKDVLFLAQSILYNVPDSAERMMILRRLYDIGTDCTKLIQEG
jgi:hypothetical protein